MKWTRKCPVVGRGKELEKGGGVGEKKKRGAKVEKGRREGRSTANRRWAMIGGDEEQSGSSDFPRNPPFFSSTLFIPPLNELRLNPPSVCTHSTRQNQQIYLKMRDVSFYIKIEGLLTIINLNPLLPSSLLGSTRIND